jgi:hypothetical protein
MLNATCNIWILHTIASTVFTVFLWSVIGLWAPHLQLSGSRLWGAFFHFPLCLATIRLSVLPLIFSPPRHIVWRNYLVAEKGVSFRPLGTKEDVSFWHVLLATSHTYNKEYPTSVLALRKLIAGSEMARMQHQNSPLFKSALWAAATLILPTLRRLSVDCYLIN